MNRLENPKRKIDLCIRLILVFIVVSVLFVTVAYAAFSTTARIEGIMATVAPRTDARITALSVTGTLNGGVSNAENYNVSKIYGSISLPNADSTVTYRVSATVFLASEMKISSISGLDPKLDYELTDYTIGDPLCNTNNECNYGATDDFYITIKYKTGEYDSTNTTYPLNVDFTFEQVTYSAKIGNTRYTTIQAAVNTIPANDTEVTVTVIKNTSEMVTINAHQSVALNLQTNTLSNSGGNPVIWNYGTLKISNGTISCASAQGAINNQSTGTLYVSGGRILATGTKQAIYNDNGTLYISGDAYLSSTSNQRATVHNLANGTAVITGGTIYSTRFYGIENLGTLTIGDKDGTVDTSTPIIKGETYGIYTTPGFNFYDGSIEGKTDAVNDELLITDIETGNEILHAMDGSYKKISLGLKITITFNANGGSVSEVSREISQGAQIGNLPVPTRGGYDFLGWFTAASGGTQVLATTTFNADDEIFAQWEENHNYVANIGGTYYESLQSAVNAVPTNNTKVVITILQDINNENIYIARNRNIELDMGSYTISNTAGVIFDNYGTLAIKDGYILRTGTNDQNRVIMNRSGATLNISGGDIKSNCFQVIRNYGTLNITGGKIWATSNVDQGIINNESGGTFTISGGQIIGTKRQAIYNDGGTLLITGNPTLINGSGATANRACVQNHTGTTTIEGGTITSPSSGYPAVLNEATMRITGGTITSSAQNGVSNTATLTIGTKDSNIDASNPVITGFVNGVNNTSTLKFYDGIIKGINRSINGTVAEYEDNSTRVEGTEDIGGNTYHTLYLQ